MKKVLDIKLKEVVKFNFNPPMCVYDNIAAIANYFNTQYELMFIDVIDFKGKIYTNGNKIEITEEKIDEKFKLLEKYHGLVIKNQTIDSFDEFIGVLKNELSKGNPLMVGIDAYLCPWDPAYNKGHITHICLLSGIDEDEEILYFTDPFHSKKGMTLSFEDFSKAYSKYYTFEMIERERADINAIFMKKIKWIKNNSENEFARFLLEAENIFINLNQYDEESLKNFYFQFKEIILREAYNFTCFTNIIMYLKQSDIKYDVIADQYEQLFSHMMVLYSILWKGMVSGNMYKLVDNVVSRLRTISELHRKNIEDIVKICDKGAVKVIDNKTKYKTGVKSEGENAFVDLSECFNNKGIGDFANRGNLIGFGEYILKNKDLDRKYLDDGCVKFQMALALGENPDNIICNSQNLEIADRAFYNTLNILGCSEFGSNQGKLKIIYENGEWDEMFIKFPDFYIWDNAVPDDCRIIWTGKAAFVEGGHPAELSGTAYLYYNRFALKNNRIKNIILPDAPYLHVFGITLSDNK